MRHSHELIPTENRPNAVEYYRDMRANGWLRRFAYLMTLGEHGGFTGDALTRYKLIAAAVTGVAMKVEDLPLIFNEQEHRYEPHPMEIAQARYAKDQKHKLEAVA